MTDKDQPSPPDNISDSTVAKNSMVIMLPQGLGVAAGIGFDLLIILSFGISIKMDAVFVALALPTVLISVVNSNSVRVFSPIFTEVNKEGGDKLLTNVFSAVVNYGLIFLVCITVFGIIGSRILIDLLAPGLSIEAEELAVSVSKILFLSLLPLAIVGPLNAVFVTRHRFFVGNLYNFLRFGSALITLLILRESLGVLAIGWAYVAGTYFPAIILAIFYIGSGGRYLPTLGRKTGILRTVTARIGPPTIGELAGQSNILIERFFASFLSPGMISAFAYGRRILIAMNGVLSNSVAVAILPRLSVEAASRKVERLRESLFFGTKLIAIITGVAIIVLISMSHSLVALLFGWNNANLVSTTSTASIISIFAPALLLLALTQLYMAPHFALGETRIVMYFRLLFLGIYFVLSYVFLQHLGDLGLAYSLIASLVILLVIWIVANAYRLHGLAEGFLWYMLKLVLILALVCGGLYLVNSWYEQSLPLSVLLPYNLLVMLLGLSTFGVMSFCFGLVPKGSLSYLYNRVLRRSWESEDAVRERT